MLSLMLALIVGVAIVGLGVTVRFETVGALVSI